MTRANNVYQSEPNLSCEKLHRHNQEDESCSVISDDLSLSFTVIGAGVISDFLYSWCAACAACSSSCYKLKGQCYCVRQNLCECSTQTSLRSLCRSRQEARGWRESQLSGGFVASWWCDELPTSGRLRAAVQL